MIKESKIKELREQFIIPSIEAKLSSLGFVYKKSKNAFYRNVDSEYEQSIVIHTNAKMFESSDIENITLNFELLSRITLPHYEKWHKDTYNRESRFRMFVDSIVSFVNLSKDNINPSDYYQGSKSKLFKNLVSNSISNAQDSDIDNYSMDRLINEGLTRLVENLNSNSELTKIAEQPMTPWDTSHIPIFKYINQPDKANLEVRRIYNQIIVEVENAIDSKDRARKITKLESFKKAFERSYNIHLDNPFKTSIKKVGSLKKTIILSDSLIFETLAGFNVSDFEESRIFVFSDDCIIIVANRDRCFRLTSEGKIKLDTNIQVPKGYSKLNYDIPIRWIGALQCVIVNHMIIKDEIVSYLEFPDQCVNNGSYSASGIYTNREENEIYFQLENWLLVYDSNFQLTRQQKYNNQISKIIPEKKWVIIINQIFDFDGNLINEFKVGKGNERSTFSNDFDFVIFHGYATKSQCYNLNDNSSQTLWAHPTFVKNYKETLFNDIEHNFDLASAVFSPSDKYIVGCGYHGTYACWEIPSFNRTELLPNESALSLLAPLKSTVYIDGKSKEKIVFPEVVSLGDLRFLKNRSNRISEVIFFNKGSNFITIISNSDLILVWDENFKNIGYTVLEGIISSSTNEYLIQKYQGEVTIYKKISLE